MLFIIAVLLFLILTTMLNGAFYTQNIIKRAAYIFIAPFLIASPFTLIYAFLNARIMLFVLSLIFLVYAIKFIKQGWQWK